MKRKNNGERPAKLLVWFEDGFCGFCGPRVKADVEVSIGRTNSKRALGFRIKAKNEHVIDFVLNRDQVVELAAYMRGQKTRLLKRPGRKPHQLSLAAMQSPKAQLHNMLGGAAMEAHPGWRDVGEGCWEGDPGTPSGERLVAWFKKTHSRDAARIEREFTEALWTG
jgi:hypothetical protein